MNTSKFTTEAGQEFRIHHNGDYSGDVEVVFPASWIKTGANTGGQGRSAAISIPFDALRELVFDYLRGRIVRQLEDGDDDTFEAALVGAGGRRTVQAERAAEGA